MGLRDSYHSLASSTNVKQNLCTFTPFQNACMSVQSFVLDRCTSATLSILPENSGLNCDQFNGGLGCTWIVQIQIVFEVSLVVVGVLWVQLVVVYLIVLEVLLVVIVAIEVIRVVLDQPYCFCKNILLIIDPFQRRFDYRGGFPFLFFCSQ